LVSFAAMQKILVIQTAFIGDAVLATGLLEKLHAFFPDAQIDYMVRSGNEGLFSNHPFLHEVLAWNKKQQKYKNLWYLLKSVRSRHYDKVINVQRFAATGILTALSGAKEIIGFDKNPFSFLFTKRIKHIVNNEGVALHEIERNHRLIQAFTDSIAAKPALYPSKTDNDFVSAYKQQRYVCVAPASVWFTKQYPTNKWIDFINKLSPNMRVYLLGAPGDRSLCEEIITKTNHSAITNLSGKLNFLQSCALMKDAVMNYVNDSAPIHFASSVNAPVTAVYCSTIPAFGFGPLSNKSFVVEVQEELSCRSCGLHGKKACPLGHFDCANKITDEQLLNTLQ